MALQVALVSCIFYSRISPSWSLSKRQRERNQKEKRFMSKTRKTRRERQRERHQTKHLTSKKMAVYVHYTILGTFLYRPLQINNMKLLIYSAIFDNGTHHG